MRQTKIYRYRLTLNELTEMFFKVISEKHDVDLTEKDLQGSSFDVDGIELRFIDKIVPETVPGTNEIKVN